MDRWVGKIALVTGASSGIGRAIAYALTEQGMIVIAAARRQDKLKELAESTKGLKGKLHPIACDVTIEEDVIKVVDYADKQFGGLHVIVNNAGTAIRTNVLDCDLTHWRHMFDLNVIALGMVTREGVACMKRNGIDDGHIFNISSISGHGIPLGVGKHVYCATKHAVRLISEGIRAELNVRKSGIKITTICPGVVGTEIFEVGGWNESFNEVPMLKSADIASSIISVLATPPNVLIADLVIRPLGEEILA